VQIASARTMRDRDGLWISARYHLTRHRLALAGTRPSWQAGRQVGATVDSHQVSPSEADRGAEECCYSGVRFDTAPSFAVAPAGHAPKVLYLVLSVFQVEVVE
jgi:hypothetical protein